MSNVMEKKSKTKKSSNIKIDENLNLMEISHLPVKEVTNKPKLKSKLSINSLNITEEKKKINELDEYLFHEGKHLNCYNFMGAHIEKIDGITGIRFTTWAPNASKIVVIGDFSNWNYLNDNSMERYNSLGLWTIFIPGVKIDSRYKFAITNKSTNNTVYKADPYAFKAELRPDTASIINKETKFKWADKRWLNKREKWDPKKSPINVYELHLGSWIRNDGNFMSYSEIAQVLPNYIKDMGYTHVELMPVHEHPLDQSWGYQSTGYYAPTSRHGNGTQLKELINILHKNDIGVILDWVGGHFCKDQHGLEFFDGSPTYEYQDFWKANNKGWGALNFDLGRYEVRSFLISNANYWIEEYHIDGLRVDAVSNMLYLNYDRNDGEWFPNIYGGNGNLEAIDFLKEFNTILHEKHPGLLTIAEESSSWPKITHPTSEDGLGFTFKWNMGWMNDTLSYVELDPIYRKFHHNKMNFSMMYQYSENYILPISHDEVVHGKKSLVNKMWGDDWSKYAGIKTYAGFMIGHPGKKLLFMGSEFAQFVEWRDTEELQWFVLDQYPIHKNIQNYFKTLNKLYKENPSLWQLDSDPKGFEWIEADNHDKSIFSFIRRGESENDFLIFICNFTPITYYDYEVGVPTKGEYIEILNSDALEFGGSGQIVTDTLFACEPGVHNKDYKITTKIAPLAVSVYKLK